MDLFAQSDAVERVEHGLAILSTMPVICGLPALVRAKPAKGSAKRSLVEWLVKGGSMSSIARENSHSWRSWVPRYSAPRSMRPRRGTAPFSAWKDKTPPFRRSAAMIGVLRSWSLAAGLGIGVDEGLPADPANFFQRAHMKGVSRAAKPKTFGFDLALYLFPAI